LIGRDGHRNQGYKVYSQNRNLSRLKLSKYWQRFETVPVLQETITLKFQKRRNMKMKSFHFSVSITFQSESGPLNKRCKRAIYLSFVHSYINSFFIRSLEMLIKDSHSEHVELGRIFVLSHLPAESYFAGVCKSCPPPSVSVSFVA
jgi:hypothetical protein